MNRTAVLLLAGGVGSRLSILVANRAKPAVPFGGIYRIIDSTLSNISNSGLTDVAVLTQYKPLSLMDHIGDGSSWGLSGRFRSVKILPPKTGKKEWDWYKGTADAVRQNLDFILRKEYDDVLIVSGDHIYNMDYRSMLDFHNECGAKVTLSFIEVPWEETNQFGTAIVDDSHRITAWEEKSPHAKSNLASMGIYVFNRAYLVELLETTKQEDFGHHIIPRALAEGNIFAYPFSGYWRDVGTIQAYWEANMDLLDPSSGLSPESWHLMTNVMADGVSCDRQPIKIKSKASVVNSVISPGCVIYGTVESSILSPGVVVEEGAFVKDSIIMHDSHISSGVRIVRSILDKHVSVGKGTTVGGEGRAAANRRRPDNTSITLIGKDAVVPAGAVIGTNCSVHSGAKEKDFRMLRLANGESL